MPHSSGGGSHSGGSHSGSGFSGSSSSSGGSSAKHIKHTSFPGARRYVYYENYRPVYVYADYDIRKGTASGKFFSILGSAVSLLFGIMLLAMCYDKPQKMDTSPSYHCEIKDTAGVIDDMDKVQNAIVDFLCCFSICRLFYSHFLCLPRLIITLISFPKTMIIK